MMWRELFTRAVFDRSGASKQLAPHSLHLFLKDHESLLRGYLRGGYFDAGFAKSAIIALAARCKSSGVRIICSPRRPALTLTRS
jgi:hypothetical protein